MLKYTKLPGIALIGMVADSEQWSRAMFLEMKLSWWCLIEIVLYFIIYLQKLLFAFAGTRYT